MTSTGTVGSSAHESRTFDCPWCGAISPVPADHLGEHFACPECRQQTKLTEKNTSTRHVTETPPDAPHLSGDRTFDCPWCGAISAVPSSHLGERFVCPECSRDTKLTPTNTRRAPITAPPPDAPPPEPTGAPKALIAVAAVIVVGIAAWAIASSGGGEEAKGTETGTIPTTMPVTPSPSKTQPPKTPPTPHDVPSTGAAPAPTPTPPPPPPPIDVSPTPPAPGTPAGAEPTKVDERAAAEREAREASRVVATEAESLVALWVGLRPVLAADPELATAVEGQEALAKALAAVPPPPSGASAGAIRAYDAAVAKSIGGAPAAVKAVEAIRERMALEDHGRAVAGLTWQDLDFHGDAFHRAATAQRGVWSAALGRLPPDFVKARAEGERRLSEAQTRSDRAKARLDAFGK